MKEKKDAKGGGKALFVVFFLICLAVFAFSAVTLVGFLLEDKEADDAYGDLRGQFSGIYTEVSSTPTVMQTESPAISDSLAETSAQYETKAETTPVPQLTAECYEQTATQNTTTETETSAETAHTTIPTASVPAADYVVERPKGSVEPEITNCSTLSTTVTPTSNAKLPDTTIPSGMYEIVKPDITLSPEEVITATPAPEALETPGVAPTKQYEIERPENTEFPATSQTPTTVETTPAAVSPTKTHTIEETEVFIRPEETASSAVVTVLPDVSPEPELTLEPEVTMSVTPSPAFTAEITVTPAPTEEPLVMRVGMDFDGLKQVNPQIVAWINCPGTVIDYPVLQANDNTYYLNHMYNGTVNSNGSIFLDYRNSADIKDRNVVLYGHHMKSGAMFGGLVYFKQQSYYDSHPTMTLFTPQGDYTVELLCGTIENGDAQFINFDFNSDEALSGYVNRFVARSTFKSNVQIEPGDRIITLCTCTYEESNARYMVIGRLVPIYN